MAKGDLTAERLREQFDYNPETGELTRKPCQRLQWQPFVSSGRDSKGYLRASVDGHQYRVHRLVWLYVHGEWPKLEIDHINRDRDDNRIANLRDVPREVNMANRRSVQRETGVVISIEHRPDRRSKFRARLKVDGRMRPVGSFETRDEAMNAAALAREAVLAGK